MIAALLDAFAASAPRSSSLQMHGNEVADAVLSWATEHGFGATTERREHGDGRAWRVVGVTLPGGAWIAAHRDDEPATISTPGTEVLL